MTERCEHGDGYFAPPERQNRPTALWLAAIPMVMASAVGLIGGNALSPRERSAPTAAALGPSAVVTEAVPHHPASHPVDRMTASTFAPTTTTFAPSTTSSTTLRPAPSRPATPPPASGCAAARQWLWTHAAPGFRIECPGNALGHQGMTCVDVAGVCPGERVIAIADACPAAYMNEAHNSWILTGMAAGRLDPYGYCG